MTRSTGSDAASDGRRCGNNGCVEVDVYDGPHLTEPVVRVHSTETGTVMQARIGEWVKFVAEVKNGDWDYIQLHHEIAATERLPSAQPGLNQLVDAAEHKAR